MDNEELKRHFDVLTEATDQKLDRILEAVSLLDGKVERHQAENRKEFVETRSMIKLSYTALEPAADKSRISSRAD